MSLLIAAVGAILAAVVESSVFTQLPIGGVKPDLLFALTMAVAMVMGFEDGMVMAFTGGLMLDLLLPERPVGSTILTLLVVTGLALLVARATEPPRLMVIAITTFALSFVYQALLLLLLALTAGIAIGAWPLTSFAFIGLLNALVATVAAWVMRAVLLRFGPSERVDW
jgi:rod shape-determining protein MreD